jgi:hypothetical protein
MALNAPSAGAELSERGNLFVRFEGGIDPNALPRTERAPIAVEVAGTVKTLSGEEPPALRSIKIELNRGGVIDSHGLPDCHYEQLVAATPARAMASCGRSLVGNGAYRSKTAFPEQASFPAEGDILAFSGAYEGHEAILAHVYGEEPVPLNQLIVFRIRRYSYISATCAAPAGFGIATFPFARTSMTFADGRRLSSTLTRSCRVSP